MAHFNKGRLREVFIPKKRIPVTSVQEIMEYRSLYSGKKDLYVSVYEYEDSITGKNAIIDEIFLDFDYDDELKFFDDVRTVAGYLHDSDCNFYIRFSGRGFHIFVLLHTGNKHNTKTAIRNWVKDMHEKTNTKSDPAVVGDLRRVSRMLGSINLKTHLYCIPVSYAELMSFTYEGICEMAKEYHPSDLCCNDDVIYGDKYHYGNHFIDLTDFNKQTQPQNIKDNIDTNNIQIQQNPPPCIESMLQDSELGYYARGMLILYLRDDGYGFEEILGILKMVLSEQKYHHCTVEEGQPSYLYFMREDLLFPTCHTLKDNGLCTSNTCDGHHLYL